MCMRVCKYEHGKVYELMKLLCNLCYKYDDTFLRCMDVCNVCVCVCVCCFIRLLLLVFEVIFNIFI